MSIGDIANAIKKDDKDHKPVLIAVEGFGGSGKTTFAEKLKSTLRDSYLISIDDFIVKERLTDNSPDKTGFDRVRLERQVLIPATTRQPIAYQRLQWAENTLSEPEWLPSSVAYLMVEGISSYHPDIAKYYDYKIWIDTPIAVAKQRGKLKDAGNENEQHWDLWAENDLAYQRKYHPERLADFTFDNNKAAYE